MNFILFLPFLCITATGSLINRVDNPCEPPIAPEYLPDENDGTYCRFTPMYSQIDFTFLLQLSNNTDNIYLEKVQSILYHSLMLFNGQFGNGGLMNDVAFVAFAEEPVLTVPFGTLTNYLAVANQFTNMMKWRDQLNNPFVNFTTALDFVDKNVFNYSNGRPKIVVLISDNDAQTSFNFTQNDINVATNLKSQGVDIFGISYSASAIQIRDTYFSAITTVGWVYPLQINSDSDTNNDLSKFFYDLSRQVGCQCLKNTAQFTTIKETGNPDIPLIKRKYGDCYFLYTGTNLDIPFDLQDTAEACFNNVTVNARPIAVNSTTKWDFTKYYFLNNGNSYWSGKNGAQWITYNGTEILPLKYVPEEYSNNETQQLCQKTYNITPGGFGAIVAHNKSHIYCRAAPDSLFYPACEARAMDSLDNPRLCYSPYVNADLRPEQHGTPCSNNVHNSWLDIIVVADVSNNLKKHDLQLASQNFLEAFKELQLNVSTKHSSRLALITYATIAKIQYNFNYATTTDKLEKMFNLSKYHMALDNGRNPIMAFTLAKSILLSQKSSRRPVLVFLTSGFKKSFDPTPIANILKSTFNTVIISINTTSSESINGIASYGFNFSLDNKLSSIFPFSLTQSNCFCAADLQQFIYKDSATGRIIYTADCLKGFASSKSVEDGANVCSKNGGVLVSLTHKDKAAFIFDSVIHSQLNYSPIFSIGLQRHKEFLSRHVWADYAAGEYIPKGTYPPFKDVFNFNDFDFNCTAAIQQQNNEAVILPLNCKAAKLPFVCQYRAKDSDNY